MSEGWISIHRKLWDHWLFNKKQPLTNFEAWLFILKEVNHKDCKFLIKGTLFECKRGESLKSLDTWARLLNWNKSKVRRFFNLLQNDSMIVLKSEQKTTRLTVCNYESYQDSRNTDETQVKRKRNGNETPVTPNNNVNNKVISNMDRSHIFYKTEINKNKESKHIEKYKMFYSYLCGKNDLELEMSELLKLQFQVSFINFCKLLEKSIEKQKKFKDMLHDMYNNDKYTKGRKSLYLILNSWLNK